MNNKLQEKYESRYELIYPEANYYNHCFYCGDYSDLYDYFPTLTNAHLYHEKSPHYKVPACKECYNLLKDKVHDDLKERRDIAQKLLRKKHKKVIANGMQWSENEISNWEQEDPDSSLLKQVKAIRGQYKIIKRSVSFKGYEYEYRGEKCDKGETFSLPNITVNDTEYDSIEDAVLNLSKQLNVNSNKFYEQLTTGLSFQETYNFIERDKTVNVE